MKKGFTLIELIAVIAIIAMIALIITPIITSTITKSKNKLNETQKIAIEKAAANWGVVNIKVNNNAPNYSEVSVNDLKDAGYLDDKTLKNIETNSVISNGVVCITWDNGQLNYEFKEEGCTETQEEGDTNE